MKKILSILLIFVVVFSFSLNVYAEEENQQEESEEENKEYNRYYIQCLQTDGSAFGTGNINFDGEYYDSEFSIDKKLVLVKYTYDDSCEMKLYLYDESKIYLSGKHNTFAYVTDYVDYVLHKPLHTIRGRYSFISTNGEYMWVKKDADFESEDSFGAYMHWASSDLNKCGFIKTNIPIFTSEEQALGYINGSISITEAENYLTDICKTTYNSSEVPLPRNLHIEHENYNYYIVWEYSSEDLKKLSYVGIAGMVLDAEARVKKLGSYTPFLIDFEVGLDEIFEPRLTYKLDVTEDVNGLRKAIEDKIGTYMDYKATLNYVITSAWFKSEFEHYHSNIAHVNLYLSDTDEGFVVDFDTVVTDNNMNVIDDVIFDSGIDIGTDSSNFIGNIVNAFGLLGDNGLIACCKAIFSCFPSFIWELIGAGLSVAIVVFLVKLLFK